jgi:hypothetical protein
VLALGIAGCADDGYRHGGGSASVAYYDGYYDDYYGPFHDGYWGGDGFFYYSAAPGAEFRRDEARHFRREQAQGFHQFHGVRPGGGHMTPAAARIEPEKH